MFWLVLSEKIWLLNIQCTWMIHCTNLKWFPQYLKCPRVNHSITSDENSPRPPFKSLGFPLSYLKCLHMGEGGSRPLLENVQKEAAFSSVWLPLVDQRFVINATGLLRLIFLTSLYLILWNYSTVSIFCCCVCVWECQQNPGMNFYYLYIAEIVGHMELVDSKPLPKLHKWIC